MSSSAEAEFDTLAHWTAEVATELGTDYYVPAGCRGSGSPAALDWLIDRMGLEPGDVLLDCGAGVGGPAAYAAQARSVFPVLVEPEPGACWAARKLFGYPVVRASGAALPISDSVVEGVWSLGVLCTVPDQLAVLNELRRVVRPNGRIGLLAFIAHSTISRDELPDNNFPSDQRLVSLISESSLHVTDRIAVTELPAVPQSWNRRVDEVTDALEGRYGHSPAWQLAERQSSTIGQLLQQGILTAELFVLQRV